MLDALTGFRELLANSETWQDVTGSDDATEAAAFIYSFGRKPRPTPPACYIRADAFSSRLLGFPSTWQEGGSVQFRFEFARPSETTVGEEYEAVCETMQDICREIAALAGTGTYMSLAEFTVNEEMINHFTEDAAEISYWQFTGAASWPAARG